MNKWLNFKLLSSLMLLLITTIYALISENTYGYDISEWAIKKAKEKGLNIVPEVTKDF